VPRAAEDKAINDIIVIRSCHNFGGLWDEDHEPVWSRIECTNRIGIISIGAPPIVFASRPRRN
jgi:hypothetical protein